MKNEKIYNCPYKVGDTVIVRKDLTTKSYYDGIYFTQEMSRYMGRAYKIKSILASKYSRKGYIIKLKYIESWSWDLSMLEIESSDNYEIF